MFPSASQAAVTPSTPPTPASSTFDGHQRHQACRPAPRAVRSANSRWRAVQRAPVRLATLTQAMRSAIAIAPSSSHNGGLTFAAMASESGVTTGYVNRRLGEVSVRDALQLRARSFYGDARPKPEEDSVVIFAPRSA